MYETFIETIVVVIGLVAVYSVFEVLRLPFKKKQPPKK